ncbi:MAG: glycosyltransferase family 39 protein [Proteobacteria bacterium]|nr:glycosyltransferase family 39 protein [Pseudomonadota bacterium]
MIRNSENSQQKPGASTRIAGPQTEVTSLAGFAIMLFLASVLCLYFFPMMTDEAYYLDWARRSTFPDFGFFDHPPFVSWQAVGGRFVHKIWFARLGVLLASLLTFFVNWRTAFEIWGSRTRAWTAAVIAQLTIGGIANSFLLTPDSSLAFFWSLSLHEGVVALTRNPKRWLSAGLATGAGLLSKYTMVLIGPVFLLGLLLENKKQLRTPWPYLGGLLALLVFLPNIWWNSQNHWVTINFQFNHGFSVGEHLKTGSSLPPAEASPTGSTTMNLYLALQKAMGSVAGFEETKHKIHTEKSFLEKAWQYSGDYLGGVAGLWGLLLIALSLTWRPFSLRSRELAKNLRPPGVLFLRAAFLWPLGFFLVLSPFSKIEANWPAMHIASAAILLAGTWSPSRKTLMWIYMGHCSAAAVLIMMTNFPNIAPGARDNRLIVEASGYDQLAAILPVHLGSTPLAVDSYQLKSALASRLPNLATAQWPGITRPSEYTRGGPDDLGVEKILLNADHFYLLTFEDIPPELPGRNAVFLEGIRSCPEGRIAFYSTENPVLPCVHGLKDWWLVRYNRI